jgi:tetratricopeptide (TPR) repeat protein
MLGIERVASPEGRYSLAKKLALQYVSLARYRSALEAYEIMAGIEPGAEPLVGIGSCYWRLGEHEQALVVYRRAIEADPTNSLALANFAQLSAALGHKEEARATCERLLALPAESVDPRAAARARAFLESEDPGPMR